MTNYFIPKTDSPIKHRAKITISEQAWIILQACMLVRREYSQSKIIEELILKHLPSDSDSRELNWIGDRQFKK